MFCFNPICLNNGLMQFLLSWLFYVMNCTVSLHSLRISRTINTRVPPLKFSAKDEGFMRLALRHAQHAFKENEVPVGAVLVDSAGVVLAATRNCVECSKDASAHAEINALRKAAKLRNDWRLTDCTLYSTLEPCAMCFSAMQSFRVKRLVFGADDVRLGVCGSWLNLANKTHPIHNIEVDGGLFSDESANLLKRFFQQLRSECKSSTVENITEPES